MIAPSILSADFGKLNSEMKSVEKHVDLFHVDVMDGHFVPNITFGPPAIASIDTPLPLDCHLMISNPEKYIDAFVAAIKNHKRPFKKCYIVVHREVFSSSAKLKKTLKKIRRHGIRAGIAVNPETPITKIFSVLKHVDMVLVMSVHPGFGGQGFIKSFLSKIRVLRKKMPKLNIEIDGGINDKTVLLARAAGANIIVAGSYIFHSKNRIKAIDKLKQ